MTAETRLWAMLLVMPLALLVLSKAAAAQSVEENARAAFRDDAHAGAGLTCESCHGGGPVRSGAAPHSASYAIRRTAVAPMCARCHSDAAYMRRFAPQLRIDQYAEYVTSTHGKRMAAGEERVATCSTCHGSHGATPPGVDAVANVCSQCHAREAELFRASPKKAIFEAMGQAECLACHGNHRIEHPSDEWVGLQQDAVCAKCHDESTGGAKTIVAVRQGLDRLSSQIAAADAVLGHAERAGMLVDEGRVALRQAADHRIQSRVLVHAFAVRPFDDMAGQGLAAAERARAVGEEAQRELQFRRQGLGVATFLILGFLVTLWWKIRRLPQTDSQPDRP